MRESELLGQIYAASTGLSRRYPDVVVGPGDDCAVVGVGPQVGVARAGRLLLTVDQLIEGRHYLPETSLDLVARKAVARSVSDIAAMAGEPRWALATAALPRDDATWPGHRAHELFEAMRRWAERWGCPLVGGDIATTERGTPVVLTLTIGGDVHPTRGPVLRSGARPGDEVWMSGVVGSSLPSARHLTFEPRLVEARWLATSLGERLHAMIDLSDGLGRDAARVALASGVRLELDATSFPLADAARSPLDSARDGEDYELLFCIEPGALGARSSVDVPGSEGESGTGTGASLHATTRLTRIGRVVEGRGCVIVDQAGRAWDATELGWDH
jgi:thiamine-monophosphate kinase